MTEYIGYLDEDHAPVVDMAQEVVRCRDCKHMQAYVPFFSKLQGKPVTVYCCEHFWNPEELPEVEPDGYCAWGERRNA